MTRAGSFDAVMRWRLWVLVAIFFASQPGHSDAWHWGRVMYIIVWQVRENDGKPLDRSIGPQWSAQRRVVKGSTAALPPCDCSSWEKIIFPVLVRLWCKSDSSENHKITNFLLLIWKISKPARLVCFVCPGFHFLPLEQAALNHFRVKFNLASFKLIVLFVSSLKVTATSVLQHNQKWKRTEANPGQNLTFEASVWCVTS